MAELQSFGDLGAVNDQIKDIKFRSSTGKGSLRIQGTFVGTVALEVRDVESGGSYVVVESFTAPTKKIIDIGDDRDLWRLRMTAWTSGVAEVLLSQSTTKN